MVLMLRAGTRFGRRGGSAGGEQPDCGGDSGWLGDCRLRHGELLTPQTYRLTRLLRRQGGTDFAMAGAEAGARVIVLDGNR